MRQIYRVDASLFTVFEQKATIPTATGSISRRSFHFLPLNISGRVSSLENFFVLIIAEAAVFTASSSCPDVVNDTIYSLLACRCQCFPNVFNKGIICSASAQRSCLTKFTPSQKSIDPLRHAGGGLTWIH